MIEHISYNKTYFIIINKYSQMGNKCMRKEFDSHITQESNRGKRQGTYLDGQYLDKLNDNRNTLVKSR